MIDLLREPLFTLGEAPDRGEQHALPGWIHAWAEGRPLEPLRAQRAMRFPLLMHLADLALAALSHDARVEGLPLDADAMLERFYGWPFADWERALRALADGLAPTMYELVIADPEMPAYLQPPIGGLLERKKKALPRAADCVCPDDLNPLGMRTVHDRHHGSWPGDVETWALSVIVR